MYQMLLFLLVLAITNFRSTQGNGQKEKFVCENFSCTQATVSNNTVQYYESVELCRLVCGQFGNLWPIPTETLQLGRMAMEIDPTTVEILIDDHGSKELKAYLNDISKLFLMKLWQGCEMTRKPSTIVQVRLRAKHDDLTLDMDTSESYKISVSTNADLVHDNEMNFIEKDSTCSKTEIHLSKKAIHLNEKRGPEPLVRENYNETYEIIHYNELILHICNFFKWPPAGVLPPVTVTFSHRRRRRTVQNQRAD